eukprot:jgi/Orpsp1_1/1179651/evm.model.c7180000070202.1
MKLNSVLEKVQEGLKYKKYDWILYVIFLFKYIRNCTLFIIFRSRVVNFLLISFTFNPILLLYICSWSDSDTMIINPNIKLESFLPSDKMSKIHFIAGIDRCGLQLGVFFIHVHEWSLNMLMRAISYSYFKKNKGLKFEDQSMVNNILTEYDESEHYVIVPQKWFNQRIGALEKGDFLLHIMGKTFNKKMKIAKDIRDQMKNDTEWQSKTNKEIREEVLKYYDLPKSEQLKIRPQ